MRPDTKFVRLKDWCAADRNTHFADFKALTDLKHEQLQQVNADQYELFLERERDAAAATKAILADLSPVIVITNIITKVFDDQIYPLIVRVFKDYDTAIQEKNRRH